MCMGGCEKYGPFVGTLNIRCLNIIGIQKGTIILTTMCIPLGYGMGLCSNQRLCGSGSTHVWGSGLAYQ